MHLFIDTKIVHFDLNISNVDQSIVAEVAKVIISSLNWDAGLIYDVSFAHS